MGFGQLGAVIDDRVITCFVFAGVDRAMAMVAGVVRASAEVQSAVAGVDRDLV